jgi:uncharacterized protein YjaZ
MACSSPSSNDSTPVPQAVALEGGSSLVFQDGGALVAHRDVIVAEIQETVVAVRRLMDVSGVTIRVNAGTASVIREIGMGGRTTGPGEIVLVFDAASSVMPSSLSTELFPLLAHEMHHVARFRTVGYGSTLLEAMVSEGLADQFSIEVGGIDPPIWSIALSAEELEVWSERAKEQWYDTRYDHDAWFFGTGGEIPRWAGYSIGFAMTQAFLVANPDRKPSRLFAEPASSFAQYSLSVSALIGLSSRFPSDRRWVKMDVPVKLSTGEP